MTSPSNKKFIKRTWKVSYKLTLFPGIQFSRWFKFKHHAENFVRNTNYLSTALIERKL